MNWNFQHRPEQPYEWAAYYSPMGWEMYDVYEWCRQRFGVPGEGRWDNVGGWIRFRDGEDVTLFLLRWS